MLIDKISSHNILYSNLNRLYHLIATLRISLMLNQRENYTNLLINNTEYPAGTSIICLSLSGWEPDGFQSSHFYYTHCRLKKHNRVLIYSECPYMSHVLACTQMVCPPTKYEEQYFLESNRV
jgi:hypothetical protein